MYSINDEQIDYILNDIRRRGVEMEDLQSNLLDHICCIVEQNLKSDGDFEDFYKKTIPKFFKHELWEIEEETILLLTYKNYYTMKKAMILGGNISLALIAMGTVCKIMHWPGAAFILLIGFAILCFLFFPAAIYLNHKSNQNRPVQNLSILIGGITLMVGILFKIMHWPGSHLLLLVGWTIILGLFLPILLFAKLKETSVSNEKTIYVLGAVGLVVFELATMFKFFHWPGAGPLMILGSLLLVGVFVPLYTKQKISKNEMNTGQFAFVVILSMYAVVLTFMLAINVSGPVLERFTKDESNSSKIISYFEKKNARLSQLNTNDSTAAVKSAHIEKLNSSTNKISGMIFDLKCELISAATGSDKKTAGDLAKNPELITDKSNYDKSDILLFNSGTNARLTNLKNELSQFRQILAETASPEILTAATPLLNTEDSKKNGEVVSWEMKNFLHSPLVSSLSRLSELEKNLKYVKSQTLSFTK